VVAACGDRLLLLTGTALSMTCTLSPGHGGRHEARAPSELLAWWSGTEYQIARVDWREDGGQDSLWWPDPPAPRPAVL